MIKNQKYIGVAFLIGIVYRLLMGLQGIDNVDTGFCMTFYQNFFTHPESMPFYFNYYLTGLIGGVWQLLFGQFGLLGFRVLETATMATAIWLLYLAFRPWLLSVRVAVIAILLSFLFPSFVITFHYDTLSFLLMAVSVYVLSHWFRGGSPLWLIMAGAMIGLSFFSRMAFFTLVALTLLPLFWGSHTPWRQRVVNAVLYLGGMALAVVAMVVVIVVMGDIEYVTNALMETLRTTSNSESPAAATLFGIYMKSYVNIGLQILVIALIALYFGDAALLSARLRIVVRIVMTIGLFVLVLTSQPYLSAAAFCTLLIVISPRPMPLAFYALACAYLFPFGSDTSIPGVLHWCGGLLIIPAATCFRQFSSHWQRLVTRVVIVCIALNMIYKMGIRAYGESDYRTETTTIALPHTLNVMTSAERAENYRREVALINEYAGNNNLLLLANQASELYYATAMVPFTGHTSMAAYTEADLIERLDEQYVFYRQLPLIVYLNRYDETGSTEAFRETLSTWMRQQNYRKVYSGDGTEIWRSDKQYEK